MKSFRHIRSCDFTIFDSCRVGWLHWDLWVDNLLLNDRSVAGIVDFDRMAVAYPEIDVARVNLSGALEDGGRLRVDAAEAFFQGYKEFMDVPLGVLPRSLKNAVSDRISLVAAGGD